ncbi:MAG TPA: amino acid adenylation domain-containing protein [Verrucomicrobiae bacterium]
MSTTYADIAHLDAEQKRALLEQLLREKSRRPKTFPLSFAQQRLWFLDKLQPNSAAYNVPTVVRLSGPIDLEPLRQALDKVVERHESLRTTFEGNDDSPAQKINPPTPVNLQFIDLTALPEAKRKSESERITAEEIRKPFDLGNDLMIRSTLIRLAHEEHILVLVTHHVASDEWSLRILFREWAAYYTGIREGKEVALPELPIQYADFAQWQRDWLESDDYKAQLEYWSKRLQSPPVLQLPTDRPRAATQTFNGALHGRSIPRELVDRLKTFSRQERCTVFMTLLAAFKVLMHRYTEQEDIIVGCPIAGRNRLETEPLVGFFVNTLAVRTSLAGEPTFRALLKSVRESTLGAYANQDMPFDKLVEELHPQRSSTHMPFVQVVFSLNNEFVEEQIFPGVHSDEIEVDTLTSKFDLTVIAKDTPHGLNTVIEYNTDLFDEERISRLLGHFEQLLESILANPDESISRLEMLPSAERYQLLTEWNNTTREYPRNAPVHEIFEQQVARSPNSLALQFENRSITYAELNTRANQIAHYLRANGIVEGGQVGVYMERSIDMVAAFLGILKAGAAYVPLDVSYPKERLEFMVLDTKMPVILTQGLLRSNLPASAAKVIALDAEMDVLQQQPMDSPPAEVDSESLAYVIYTSGSTGKPKGVPVPHRGITRLVLNTDYVSLTPTDRIAQASNASFDAATFEIWGALLNGGCAIGIQKEVALSPSDFVEALRKERITTLFLTTALFNQLAREVPGAFATLTNVLFGGEAVDPKWVRAVLECDPPKRLLHVYGPTENTTFSTWHHVKELMDDATVPIGKPIANSTLYILNRQMQPVPIGVPGEVYVGGEGLAHGYWERPELTAEKFVRNPFSHEPNSKLYKTGDIGRFDRDGNVEFIGRVDHQIKLRGFRIELGEIEALLARHPQVGNAVALLREDLPGDKRLVAYIIPRDTAPISADLKAYLKAELPEYMVPSAFVVMDNFPLTPNEKVDRKALPAPEKNRPDLNRTFLAPRDSVEQQLAKIWEKVLGVQPIGVADNFFDLGGHSLLAVKVFSQIEKTLGKKLPLATLFRAPTIEEIARVLREDNQAKSWSTIVDIQPKGSRPPFFWIHTLGGDGGGGFFYYRKLAELLGPDQPSFGIRSPQEPFSRIEEMAKFYIKEIRKFQPEGPYYLGGFCFGGNVAFEMAQQLTAAGEKIGLLVMLESSPPNVNHKQSWSATAAKYSLENIVENVKAFAHGSSEQKLALLKTRGKKLAQKFKKKIAPDQENGAAVALNQILDLSTYPEGYVTYAETHWDALTHYHPQPYSGEITLFRAKKQGLSNFNHALSWDVLAGNRVSVTVVPGTHESMLQEPNVQIVAARLRGLLEEAAKKQCITVKL